MAITPRKRDQLLTGHVFEHGTVPVWLSHPLKGMDYRDNFLLGKQEIGGAPATHRKKLGSCLQRFREREPAHEREREIKTDGKEKKK